MLIKFDDEYSMYASGLTVKDAFIDCLTTVADRALRTHQSPSRDIQGGEWPLTTEEAMTALFDLHAIAEAWNTGRYKTE